MRYCVGRGVIGPWPFLEIAADEYEHAKQAKRNIFLVVGIEEKFDMLIENYLDYERELLNLALNMTVTHRATWDAFHDAMSLLNRRLANLLSVARLYIDQVKHDFSSIYDRDDSATAQVCSVFSAEYDRLLGYRVMEALRNFMQHRALPITSVSYPTGWEQRGGSEALRHRAVAMLRLVDLRADKAFKPAVFAELEPRGSKTQDITPYVREYLEGLSQVHKHVRQLTTEDIEQWKRTVLEMIERYSLVCGDDVKSVCMYHLVDEDTTNEETVLFRDGIDRLEALRQSSLPTNVSRWYVSNETD